MARPSSDKVTAWLDRLLATAGEGQRIPADREIARSLGVSPRTVSSVMATYRSRGLIERTPGRGTRVAGASAASRSAAVSPRSSVETLVMQLEDLIAKGELRRGQALPQVKYTSLQFRVGRQTVAAAYRSLEVRGVVSRVGRSYWVGTGLSLLHGSRSDTVVVVKYQSDDFTDVFSTDMCAPAYRECEAELVSLGYRLAYCSSDELPEYLSRWRPGRLAGMLLVSVGVPDAVAILEGNPRIRQLMERRGMRILIDRAWRNQPQERERGLQQAFTRFRDMRGVLVMQRGHLYTSVARALARSLVESGCRRARVHMDEKALGRPDWSFVTLLRIRTELLRLDESCEFRLVVSPAVDGLDTQQYLALHTGRQAYFGEESEARVNLSKYGGVNPQVLREECAVCHDLASMYAAPSAGDVWVFTHDHEADRALTWCRQNRIRIPEDLGIIGLQNDPRYYHRGISACAPDWRATGYLMAHALVGDIPVARTAKGYLGTRASVVHRRTTM